MRVVANEPPSPCPCCGTKLQVEKTFSHHGATLTHGPFIVNETIYACPNSCRQQGQRVRQRQAMLADHLVPRSIAGYDVMTFVGTERFVHTRQREEIRAALQDRYAITLSTGEVSALERRFLVYLETLHQRRAPQLRVALAADGGWPLHVDATGEDGRGTLLVVYAGWRGWVLGSWKIPTERADAILPRLRWVAQHFGAPCAVMRDLGRAVTDAANDFVAGLGKKIPVLACHFHFLKDIGKDLLTPAHDELRGLFRRFELRGKLRSLTRELGRDLGTDLEQTRKMVTHWLDKPCDRYQLPTGAAGLGVVRALAQWVLDFAQDGDDEGFPFDLPWLDFYQRCRRACRATEAFLRAPNTDKRVHKVIRRLHHLLAPVWTELPFQRPAQVLKTRAHLFTELREAMRLYGKPSMEPSTDTVDSLRDIERALTDLACSLRERRPQRGPAQDLREAIDIILVHLKRHGPSLWGHVITLPQPVGASVRLVARTNTLLESFFHGFKHAERRRSGRKILTQDLESLPGATLLAYNLKDPSYVALLCGSLAELPLAFAQLDRGDRRLSLPARLKAALTPDADQPDVVSASMPAGDRHIIRGDTLEQLVLAAARSRPPRYAINS